MIHLKNAIRLSGVSVIALLGAGFAYAQEQDAAAVEGAVAAKDPTSTEDDLIRYNAVVVTARRRDESLMEVPVSVSALTADDLERNIGTDLSKIGELTPGVIVGNYKGNSGGSIAIRGISSSANQFGFEQAVAVVMDGVPISSARIATVGMFDLSQVEIMKGPQALFFGKNSPAGVISLTSAAPTDEREVSLKTSYEFVGDEATIEGAISGPLTDKLSGRLALRHRNLEGWMYNDARPMANPFYTASQPAGAAQLPGASESRMGDQETLGRLTLDYEFSSDMNATFKLLAGSLEDQGNGLATQNIGPCTGDTPRVFGVPDPFGDCRIDNRMANGARPAVVAQASPRAPADGRNQGEADLLVGSLNVEWNLGNFDLVSTTGYSSISNFSYSGIDETTFSQVWVVDDNESTSISQEIRLQSDFDGRFNFMVGGFYQDVEESIYNEVGILDSLGFNPVNGRYASYEKLDFLDGRTYSVFAQMLFDVTDEVEFSAGARYTDEQKKARISNLYGTNGPLGNYDTSTIVFPDSLDLTPGILAGEFTDTNVSPEATLTWRPQQDRSFYVAYKTGFKSGGFGLSTFLNTESSIADFDFDSEKAEGFEIGAKGMFFQDRLRLTSTLFAYEFEDLQVNSYDAVAIKYRVDNAGSLRQRGFDVEATYIANDWLDLRFAATYAKNEFNDYEVVLFSCTVFRPC